MTAFPVTDSFPATPGKDSPCRTNPAQTTSETDKKGGKLEKRLVLQDMHHRQTVFFEKKRQIVALFHHFRGRFVPYDIPRNRFLFPVDENSGIFTQISDKEDFIIIHTFVSVTALRGPGGC